MLLTIFFFFVRKFERNSIFGNFPETERTNLAVAVLVGCTCLVFDIKDPHLTRYDQVIRCVSCDWLKKIMSKLKGRFFRYRVSLFSCLCVFCLVTYTGLEPYTRHAKKSNYFAEEPSNIIPFFVNFSGLGFGYGLLNYIVRSAWTKSPAHHM
jgi:hypothetical protein